MFAMIFRNHKDYQDYQEFHYPIKIPIQSLKDSQTEVHKYKYHVESPATRNGLIKSLEFIVGPDTDGGIIDRYLAVNCRDSELRVGCKWIYNLFNCMCIHVNFARLNVLQYCSI